MSGTLAGIVAIFAVGLLIGVARVIARRQRG
jgi:hypothetical protein